MEKILCLEKSRYHNIAVVDRGSTRILKFDHTEQSSMSLTDPASGGFEYTDFFHLPLLFGLPLHRALFIGLGGGTGPKAYRKHYPNVFIDVVEIDPVVIEIAKKYFAVAEDDHLKIYPSDAFEFLRTTPTLYSVILHDAFVITNGVSGAPAHLTTPEFYSMIHDHLLEGGMLIQNLTGTAWAESTRLKVETLRGLFPAVYLFHVKSSLNVILCGQRSQPIPRKELLRRGSTLLSHPCLSHLNFYEMASLLSEAY